MVESDSLGIIVILRLRLSSFLRIFYPLRSVKNVFSSRITAYSAEEDDLQTEFAGGVSLLIYTDRSLLASPDNWDDCGIPDMDDPDSQS